MRPRLAETHDPGIGHAVLPEVDADPHGEPRQMLQAGVGDLAKIASEQGGRLPRAIPQTPEACDSSILDRVDTLAGSDQNRGAV
jgi:hypothetical protein